MRSFDSVWILRNNSKHFHNGNLPFHSLNHSNPKPLFSITLQWQAQKGDKRIQPFKFNMLSFSNTLNFLYQRKTLWMFMDCCFFFTRSLSLWAGPVSPQNPMSMYALFPQLTELFTVKSNTDKSQCRMVGSLVGYQIWTKAKSLCLSVCLHLSDRNCFLFLIFSSDFDTSPLQ